MYSSFDAASASMLHVCVTADESSVNMGEEASSFPPSNPYYQDLTLGVWRGKVRVGKMVRFVLTHEAAVGKPPPRRRVLASTHTCQSFYPSISPLPL